jgi:hypothetical protein
MTVTNTGIPVVSGTTSQGSTLTTTNGTWTFSLDYLTYAYQWERCDSGGASCVDIVGAVSQTYTLQAADIGHTLRVKVSATEHAGAAADKFAATTGSDSNPGTLAAPYRTLSKLANSLLPGQTGMLRGGTYAPPFTYSTGEKFQIDSVGSGTASARCTLTNYPGEKVTIQGYVLWHGSFWTFRNLYWDPTNTLAKVSSPPSSLGLQLVGNDIIFENNDVSYANPSVNGGSGVLQGDSGSNTGHRNIYRYNRFHDIGFYHQQDHGIYWGYGDDGQVYGNWFWNNNHGWCVQLYPHASRVKVFSNVGDNMGSGVVISDEDTAGFPSDSHATNNCDVYNNVFINMGTTGPDEFSAYCGCPGSGISGVGQQNPGNGSKFRDNDCYNNPAGVGTAANVTVTGNITVNPNLTNPAGHDYTPSGSTPAAVLAYGLPTTQPGPDV